MTFDRMFQHRPPPPRPNSENMRAGLRWAAETTLGPGATGISRELIGRIEGVLGPLLDMVDVPHASSDELNRIFGRHNEMLHARMTYDPVVAFLVHAILDQRRVLERLDPDFIDRADADAAIARDYATKTDLTAQAIEDLRG